MSSRSSNRSNSQQISSKKQNPAALSDFQIAAAYHQIKSWTDRHLVANTAWGRYKEIMAYEPPVHRAMEHLPMLLRLEDAAFSNEVKEGMLSAINAWSEARPLFNKVFNSVEKHVALDVRYKEGDLVQRAKIYLMTLEGYDQSIARAHKLLGQTIGGLFLAGFTYSSLMPNRDPMNHRKIA